MSARRSERTCTPRGRARRRARQAIRRTCRGETRTIRLNDIDYGVVGVLGPVALDPELDNAVFVTQWAAKHDFDTEGEPNEVLHPREHAETRSETADAIPTAINLGGTDQVSTKCRATCCKAAAQADKTLQQTALFAGLARARGRRPRDRERDVDLGDPTLVGDRHPPRASGTPARRSRLQFLLEALFVGRARRAPRALRSASGSCTSCRRFAGWVVVIDYGRCPLWIGLRRRRVRRRGPLPVGQGGAPRAAGDASSRLTASPDRSRCALASSS